MPLTLIPTLMDSIFSIFPFVSVSDTGCLFVYSLFSPSSFIPSAPPPPPLYYCYYLLSIFFGNSLCLCFLSILICACLLVDGFNLFSFSVVNISDFIHSTLTCFLCSTFFFLFSLFLSAVLLISNLNFS